MGANQPAFDLGEFLRGLQTQAAFSAAQFGLPQGQQFNYVPLTQGAQQPANSGLWNALGYAGDVLGAIQRSGDGGWAGDALGSVVKRRNAQSYNQAIQQAKLAELMQAQQLRQNQIADYQNLTGQKFLTPEVAQQYAQLAGFPVLKEKGLYGLEKDKGQDALSAWVQLQDMGFGGTSPTRQPQQAQPQAQTPAFQAPVNGYAIQNFVPDSQFSAGATQTQVPDFNGIPITPDMLKEFTGTRDKNLTRDETARKNRRDEQLRQQQINQQGEYQRGQLDVAQQNAYTARINSLSYDQRVKLKQMERRASSGNPTKVGELKAAYANGSISYPDYILALSDGLVEVKAPTQPTSGGAPRAGGIPKFRDVMPARGR